METIRNNRAALALAFAIALAAALACLCAPARAEAADVEGVGSDVFFSEGRYVNLRDYENPIGLGDFEAKGGKMRVLDPSHRRDDPDIVSDPYSEMQIFVDNILGREEGIPGFGFVADGAGDAATGASVSVTYPYVGDMRDASDPSFSVPVSIRATYTVNDGLTRDEEGDYADRYTGHPVVQIPKCFSYGVFFVGSNELGCRYEFFNADTGAPIELGRMFVTATSLNRGEGFALPSGQVSKCYVSNDATPASEFYTYGGRKTPYAVIPGSLLYDKTDSYASGWTAFVGSPDIWNVKGDNGEKGGDFQDSIGAYSFYWRSICFDADFGGSNTVEAKVMAIKTADWSGTPGIAGDGQATNGSMWFATNFTALTNIAPPAPTKAVDRTEGVRIGDAVTYSVTQRVNELGKDSMVRYSSLTMSDRLDDCLEYRSATLLGEDGAPVAGAGTASYDEATRTVSFEFSPGYLADGMRMAGESYTLSIEAVVAGYPADGSYTVPNRATAEINGTVRETNEVQTKLLPPKLAVSKSVAPSGIDGGDYGAGEEYRVGDVIEYAVTVENTEPGTIAEDVVASDEGMPDGFEAVGDPEVTAAGESTRAYAGYLEHKPDWKMRADRLLYGEPVTVTFRVRATEAVNGWEVFNSASASARNAPDAVESEEVAVWVNSPRFDLEKTTADPGKVYSVGETAEYVVVLGALEDPGTLARQTWIEDAFASDGADADEGSFAVYDRDGIDVTSQAGLEYDAEARTWRIDVAKAFGDETGYWVSPAGEGRPVWRDGSLEKAAGERNPVLADAHDYLRITYSALVTEAALGDEPVANTATANSAEGNPATDTEMISTVATELTLSKSADRESVAPGGELAYELTVEQTVEGAVAMDVVVTDVLPEGYAVDGGSIVVERDGEVQQVEASVEDGVLTAPIGDVLFGEVWTIRYRGTVDEGYRGGELVNAAKAESPSVPEPPEAATSTPVEKPAGFAQTGDALRLWAPYALAAALLVAATVWATGRLDRRRDGSEGGAGR